MCPVSLGTLCGPPLVSHVGMEERNVVFDKRKELFLFAMVGMLFCLGFVLWNSSTPSDINPQLVATAPQGIVELAADPVPHSPIFIDDDGDFAAYGFPGNGEDQPYRIENYMFIGNAEQIHIQDTTKSFIITGCQIDGVDGVSNGISLFSVTNGIVSNNIIENCYSGIYLEWSTGVTVIENICEHNYYAGIYLNQANGNNATGNTCNYNTIHGIHVLWSESNTVANNTCNGSDHYGIRIEFSNNNIVVNNTCSSNTVVGIELSDSHYNTVEKNTCNNQDMGINIISDSEHNEIRENTCKDGTGINLLSSNWNSITNNTCNGNDGFGIYLRESSMNTISNNTCTENLVGIYLNRSTENEVTNNTCNSNLYGGVYLYLSDENTIEENTCSDNQVGIYLIESSENYVIGNTCNGNEVSGIELEYEANHNTLTNNLCDSNYFGILIEESNVNTVTDNTCNQNLVGIYLYYSNENDVTKNICNINVYDGFYIYFSNDNVIARNICNNNGRRGITLSASQGNLVRDNTLSKNLAVGIYLLSSDYNVFSGNTLSKNGCGFNLTSSSSNEIYRNSIIENTIQAYEEGSIEMNFWYHKTLLIGNIWSDYIGVDFDLDGIGDTDIPWPGPGFDPYPLVVDDYDHDGLSASAERIIGTDPRVADTDRDSFNDGDEWRLYFTNPLRYNYPQEVTEAVVIVVRKLVDTGDLSENAAKPLIKKLDDAIALMDKKNPFAASKKLGDFIDAVNALIRSGRIPVEEGEMLITMVQGLIEVLSAM